LDFRPHSSPDPSCEREISRVRIEAPRTARILGGQKPERKNTLSFFKKQFTPAKTEMQGVFFLSGLLAYSPVRGAFFERMI